MLGQKNFYKFYNESLITELNALEEIRKTAVDKIFRILIPYACLFIALAAGLGFFINVNLGIWTLILGGVICAGIYTWLTDKFVNTFKDKIIAKLVNFFDSSLHYEKNKYVAVSKFNASEIFRKQPNRYSGDDYVYGKVGETLVEFSEIHASYESGSGRNRTDHKIFDGLFFIADFNKHFRKKVFVLPDTAEKLFGSLAGGFFQSMNKSRGDLIKLEDPVFEKMFAVYGEDQIEARYILTTSLMKRIADLKNKANNDIYISFVDSKVNIAIFFNRNLFEPNVFQSVLGSREIKKFFTDLELIIGIVNDLNLNTRIWSKQSQMPSQCPSCHAAVTSSPLYCPKCGTKI